MRFQLEGAGPGKRYRLRIAGATGSFKAEILLPETGTAEWNTNGHTAGLYFYFLEPAEGGAPLLSGKIAKVE